ncbi:unnamed protein product [Adineta ricciae]|uniref:Uncharacterized protein n=1 Tax=Adineta ricciae TaxID=249248 RepID=A0A813WY53_ADIRI|nr:unnamed protein product [Adineta ricciae]CAF0917095.1 unnamed protein product [Adineta ricciae]
MRASIPVLICLSVLSILIKTLFLVNESVEPCSKLCPYWSKLTNKALQFSTSHTIRHFPDFVCPQNFRNLADWVYAWPDQFHESLNVPTDNGRSIAPCLPSGSIIYVRIWEIDSFFRFIYPYLINEFVLVTGEGDMSSPTHLTHLVEPNSKIIHWFGQNGQYDVSAYEKFTHLPIGKYFVSARILNI